MPLDDYPHLYAVGLLVGKPDGMIFEPDKSFVGCLICGSVYQSSLDREPHTPQDIIDATLKRQQWQRKHRTTHTEAEHRQLLLSKRFCTPEAAQRLASLGVVAISDMVLSEEHEHALAIANSTPSDDVEH